jgi:hypothetical protein
MSGSGDTIQCPGCGAKVPRPRGGGVTRCDYCGTPLVVSGGVPAAAPPPAAPGGADVGPPTFGAPAGYGGPPAFGAPPGAGGPQIPAFPVPQPMLPKKRSRAGLIVKVVLGLLVAGGIGFFIWYMSWSRVDGKIVSSGGPLGSWSASFDECRSGDAFTPDFFGVDLLTASPRVHVQVQGGDAKATVVVGSPAGDEPHVDLSREVCSKFDVSVSWGNAEVNDVDTVEGAVHLDCAPSGGGRIQLDAEFKSCH